MGQHVHQRNHVKLLTEGHIPELSGIDVEIFLRVPSFDAGAGAEERTVQRGDVRRAVAEDAGQRAEPAVDFQYFGVLWHVVPAEKSSSHVGKVKEGLPSVVCRQNFVVYTVRVGRDIMVNLLFDSRDGTGCFEELCMQPCHWRTPPFLPCLLYHVRIVYSKIAKCAHYTTKAYNCNVL